MKLCRTNFQAFYSCLSVHIMCYWCPRFNQDKGAETGIAYTFFKRVPKKKQYSFEIVKKISDDSWRREDFLRCVSTVLNTVCYLLVTLYDKRRQLNEIPWKEKESWLHCVWFVTGWLSRFFLGAMRSSSEAWNTKYGCGTRQSSLVQDICFRHMLACVLYFRCIVLVMLELYYCYFMELYQLQRLFSVKLDERYVGKLVFEAILRIFSTQ